MGWTRCTPRERQIIFAVAKRATHDKLGALSVKDIFVASGAGYYSAILVTLTNPVERNPGQPFDLSRFWVLVGDVVYQFGAETSNLVTPKALRFAIQCTFEDNVSGALDKRLAQQEGRFHPPYG